MTRLGTFRASYVVALCCTGSFLFAYDTGIVGGVLTFQGWQDDVNLTASQKVNISSLSASLLQAGGKFPPNSSWALCIPCGPRGEKAERRWPCAALLRWSSRGLLYFADGWLADLPNLTAFFACFFVWPFTSRFGRRWSIVLAAAIFTVGCILQLFPLHGVATWYAGRVISGVGVGMATVMIPMYSAEMAPKQIRGQLGSCFQFFFTLGTNLLSTCPRLHTYRDWAS